MPRCRPCADHPRSRGVYWQTGLRSPEDGGSSPLARGLLAVRPLRAGSFRIIPARAGFTSVSSGVCVTPTDHPRSRGVYLRALSAVCISFGSSPLARGLHPERIQERRQGRIIPARAGFTPTEGGQGRRRRDHPRSRGVYTPPRPTDPSEAGSSPLARGLPALVFNFNTHIRIIPARAGFTLEVGTSLCGR